MLTDTHAHLYWPSFKEDLEEVIKRSKEAEVTQVINIGVDVKTSQESAQLGSDKVKFYSTIGIHPHEAIKYAQDTDQKIAQDIEKLEKIYLANPQKVMGVGECGLDFLFESNSDWIPSSLSSDQVKDLQRKLFIAQIELAKKLNLVLIVHCRDDRSKNSQNIECWLETLEMLGDSKAILHCYSGLPEVTQKILDRENLLVSFAATITYPKNDYLREAAKLLPLERIVLETDCPFLPPQDKRGQRNEPQTVREIASLIAEIKGTTLREVSQKTTENASKAINLL